MTEVGRSRRRVEDWRLLRGAGRFVDDVDRPGQLWLRVVRSPAAHARLLGVDVDRARELPGVLDAADAVADGAPPLHAGGNQVGVLERGFGDVDAAFERADHVVELEVEVGRHTAVPLETRGLVADYDAALGRLTIWGATKVPHFNRRVLAGLLGMPEERIALRATDAGGGFGVRGELYPEDVLVPFAARALRRPVKWIEDRAEHLVATNHSRQGRRRLHGAFA